MPDVLSGLSALVTGATSGIGRATARHLADLGAHVIVSGRDAERGDATVIAIRSAGGKADFVAADLTDPGSVRELARRATEIGGGRVDILINNAGVYPFLPTEGTGEADYDATYAINVKAPYLLVQELAPAMAARGSGAIVNVTTILARVGLPASSLYGSTKAALEQLTRCWATEFGPSGVRVNAVAPGPVRTEGGEPILHLLEQSAARSPRGVMAEPDEIAAAIGFLVGPGASNIQGSVLPVDGGMVAT